MILWTNNDYSKHIVLYNPRSNNTKAGCRWYRGIRDYLREINLTLEDRTDKTKYNKNSMENHLIHTNKNKPTQQFSTQKRTYRSECMKKYLEDCKDQTIP